MLEESMKSGRNEDKERADSYGSHTEKSRNGKEYREKI